MSSSASASLNSACNLGTTQTQSSQSVNVAMCIIHRRCFVCGEADSEVSLQPCSIGTSVCCGCGFASAVLDWHLRMLRLHLGGGDLGFGRLRPCIFFGWHFRIFGCTSEGWPWFRSHQLMHPLRLAPPYASVAPRRTGLGFGHISQCTSLCFGGTSADRPWFRSPQLRIQHGGMLRLHLGGPGLVSVTSVNAHPYASVAPRRTGLGFGRPI
jgi:hypothetical protein